MALVKAQLEVEDNTTIPCMYNPETFVINRSNSWEAPKTSGEGVKELQYLGAEAADMSLDLVIDVTEGNRDMSFYTQKLLGLMEPNSNLPGSNENSGNVRPPKVTFRWGQLSSYESVVTDMTITYTYFAENGNPLRANVSLTLKQFMEETVLTNPTSGTPRPHRVHRVQPGETLDRISSRYYGDSTKWRRLAAANQVEDPLALVPGSLLSIPELGDG